MAKNGEGQPLSLRRLAFFVFLIAELPLLLKEAGATILRVLWLRPETQLLSSLAERNRDAGRAGAPHPQSCRSRAAQQP